MGDVLSWTESVSGEKAQDTDRGRSFQPARCAPPSRIRTRTRRFRSCTPASPKVRARLRSRRDAEPRHLPHSLSPTPERVFGNCRAEVPVERGSPRAVFDTSLVAIRRARAAQIGSTSCPVAAGSSARSRLAIPRRRPRLGAFPVAPGVIPLSERRPRAAEVRFWRLGRARAPSGASTRPGDTSSTTRDPRASNARSNASNPRFSRGARLLGDRGLVRLDPPRLRAAVPDPRDLSTPPIPPPHALTCLRTSHPPTPSRSSRTHRISRPGRLLARFGSPTRTHEVEAAACHSPRR